MKPTRRAFTLAAFAFGISFGALDAPAQQAGRIFRMGVLGGSSPTTPAAARQWEALLQRLRELGYVEGQNLVIDWRWAEGRSERYHELAAEIVALKPDVIFTLATPSVSAVKRATSTIPIVMFAGDPVGAGLVASLSRPGGNITGLSLQNTPELAGKRLALLKEALPGVSRVGLLVNATLPHRDVIWRDLQSAAIAIGVKLEPFEVRGPEDFERGLASKASESFQALIVHPDPLAFNHRREIAEFGMKKRMPVMATYGFAEAGCLMSFDAHWPDMMWRAAGYVDKILKGAKPADLAIEQPTRFELMINLKTAKALGLTFAPAFLRRADQIIE